MRDRIIDVHERTFKMERVGYTMRSKTTLEQEYSPDFNEMIWRLESFVLQDHLADDYYEEIYQDKWPATTWQMFKYTNMLAWWMMWFVNRYPVRYTSNNHLVRVKIERYVSYPEANIPVPQLGRPFIYELTERVE